MYMIFILLFFIPGISTIIDFVIFLTTGRKQFRGPYGFILDLINLLGFPYFYLATGMPFDNNANILIDEPYRGVTFIVIALCLIGYFALNYLHRHLQNPVQIIAIAFLGIGIFINVAMIYQQEAIFSFFNVPIILLFIMQIVEKSNALIQANKPSTLTD